MKEKKKKPVNDRKSFSIQADAKLIAEFDEINRRIYGIGGKRTQRIIALIRADVAAHRSERATETMQV